jgi:hypothetical protein
LHLCYLLLCQLHGNVFHQEMQRFICFVSVTSSSRSSIDSSSQRRSMVGESATRRPGQSSASRHEVSLKPLPFYDVIQEIMKPSSLGMHHCFTVLISACFLLFINNICLLNIYDLCILHSFLSYFFVFVSFLFSCLSHE